MVRLAEFMSSPEHQGLEASHVTGTLPKRVGARHTDGQDHPSTGLHLLVGILCRNLDLSALTCASRAYFSWFGSPH